MIKEKVENCCRTDVPDWSVRPRLTLLLLKEGIARLSQPSFEQEVERLQ